MLAVRADEPRMADGKPRPHKRNGLVSPLAAREHGAAFALNGLTALQNVVDLINIVCIE